MDQYRLRVGDLLVCKLDFKPKIATIVTIMIRDVQAALLTTVNAPYRRQLSSGELAAALKSGNIGLGQVSSFFTEIDVEAQKAFADQHGISADKLADVAGSFQDWSGQPVALIN